MSSFIKRSLLAGSIAIASSVTPVLADSWTPAKAEGSSKNFYVNLGAGIGRMGDIKSNRENGAQGKYQFENGFAGSVGIGYDFGPIRTEINYKSTATDLNHITGTDLDLPVTSKSWVWSAFYDFRNDRKWNPYVGLGLGNAEIEIEKAQTVGGHAITKGKDDSVSTTEYKLGLTVATSDTIDIYGEVWGQTYDDWKVGNKLYKDSFTAGVTLGTRIRF